jgi:hypothetical protein
MQHLRAFGRRIRRPVRVHKEQERPTISAQDPDGAAQDKLSPLLALPTEIRVEVYSYLIQPDDTLLTALPLLHICKQIRLEAAKEFCNAAKAFNKELHRCYRSMSRAYQRSCQLWPHYNCICPKTGGCRWHAMMLSETVELMGNDIFTAEEKLRFEWGRILFEEYTAAMERRRVKRRIRCCRRLGWKLEISLWRFRWFNIIRSRVLRPLGLSFGSSLTLDSDAPDPLQGSLNLPSTSSL